MAAVYEPLPGKRKALSKLLAQVYRHRPSLTVYLAIELDLLPSGRKCASRVPGSHMKKSWDMKLFLTPVDAFLARNRLCRKGTKDTFIVKYLSIC